ncbi:MAG: PAS domain-containing protein, partial [Deltaproteobacteria bacterium]|nr:PAS domain-containing protein [Deltaproteobacteria bacterium]
DGRPHTGEQRITLRDGSHLQTIVFTAPLVEENGEIGAVLALLADITKVKELQEKFHLLFEEVPCYISVQDRDLRLLEANRAFRTDFGDEIGERCYRVYKHRSEPCITCPVAETFEDGEVRTREEVVTSRTGEHIHVLCSVAPLRNTEGEIESVMEMSTNITELRKVQSQLTSLGMLVGTVAHGIKGLLSGLDGGLYLMDSGFNKSKPERVDQGREMIRRNVDRIRAMVLNLLYFARDREIIWQPIDLEEFVESVQEVMMRRAEQVGVVLEVEVEPGTLEGDPHALHSVFVNLVENGLDACRVDKKDVAHRVTLKARPQGDKVSFEIEDNGLGMDRETKEKAFSLFFTSKGAEGTGLGLFISHKITRAHHGTIELISEPGVGTRFEVTLPATRPASLKGASARLASEIHPGSGS